jgi:hypothetical protein
MCFLFKKQYPLVTYHELFHISSIYSLCFKAQLLLYFTHIQLLMLEVGFPIRDHTIHREPTTVNLLKDECVE